MERNNRDGELRREEDGNNFMEKVGGGVINLSRSSTLKEKTAAC